MCPQHKKEIIFFCKEDGCKKPICKTCLTKEHKKHDVVEIEDKKKENLMKDIKEAKKDLTEKLNILIQTRKNVNEKTKDTVNELKKTMAVTNEKLRNMIKEVENKQKDTNMGIDADVMIINENIVLLEEIRRNMADEIEVTLKGLNDGQETLAEVINTAKL